MKLAVSDAKARLTDLVKRAEAGEEVVLTRHGQDVVRLVPMVPRPTAQSRLDLIATVRQRAALKRSEGPSAARSADFLYDDETGLPK